MDPSGVVRQRGRKERAERPIALLVERFSLTRDEALEQARIYAPMVVEWLM